MYKKRSNKSHNISSLSVRAKQNQKDLQIAEIQHEIKWRDGERSAREEAS